MSPDQPPIPVSCRELLQDDLTEHGMQQWWQRHLERDPEGSEGVAVMAARQLLDDLGHRGGYYV